MSRRMKSRHFTWMRKKLKTPIPEKEKSATTTKCEQCIASIIAPRVVRTFNPRIKKQQCVRVYANGMVVPSALFCASKIHGMMRSLLNMRYRLRVSSTVVPTDFSVPI